MSTLRISPRAKEIFQADLREIVCRTDRMFFWLLLGQWLFAVALALAWSPWTWVGQYWSLHEHVVAAAVLGGLFAAYPLFCIWKQPGAPATRHVIAVGQMLQSALLVHVTGGRIETHFHVFGSLALLAFYRDWAVLLTASAVVYLDHLALGFWLPLSVYGVQEASFWRSAEHAFWVLFEVVFLAMACRRGVQELSVIADRQAEIEAVAGDLRNYNAEIQAMSARLQQSNEALDARVQERTESLRKEVAERRQAQEALSQQTRVLQSILDNMSEAVIVADLQGKFILANPAAERLTGGLVPNLPWQQWSERYGTFYPDQVTPYPPEQLPLARAIRGEACEEVELYLRNQHRPEGTFLGGSARPIRDGQGVLQGGVVVFRDITERRRLEAQFRQSQKMEAVGRLAGGIAHDFNNLMTVVVGYSDLLLNMLPPKDPARGPLAVMKQSGERAAGLTQQLLAFSRKQVLAPVVLDLNVVVANLDKMLRPLIGEDIELRLVLDPGLRRVRADRGQIEQVLINLVVNARDAMPRGGRLTVETQNVELTEAHRRLRAEVRPGAYVMLAVTDTGCGMDASTQAHIFEPFFTTKGPGKGTGLGLATVYGIVKQSEGHVFVYSEPGHGTAMKVYLPQLSEGQTAPAERPHTNGARGGTETILLVEDEPAVRSLARVALQSKGYSLLEAGNGGEALRLCQEHAGSIDLLLTDVVMPGMSGRQLAEDLTGLVPSVRVLFMSGYTDEAIVHHGVLDPGKSLLQKPFTPDGLARKVRQVLDAVTDA